MSELTTCNTLNIEPEVRFMLNGQTYYVDEDNMIHYDNDNSLATTSDVYDIFNNANLLIHKYRLTKEEKAICNLFHAKYVSMDDKHESLYAPTVDLWKVQPEKDEGYYADSSETGNENLLATVSIKFFPTLKYGMCIEVEDN